MDVSLNSALSLLKGKKQLNLIIGFDTVQNYLKIMRIVGNQTDTCMVDYINVDKDLIVRGEWSQILTEYLPKYIEEQNFDKTFAVQLVLPDRVVGTDVLVVPTLSRSKMNDALQSQMAELYKFFPDYKFNTLPLSSNKTNSSFEIVMVNKDLLAKMYKALSVANKVYAKNVSYEASTALNAVFALRPKTRKTNFLFLDIKETSARLSVCCNGTTVGWQEIPFGYNVLVKDKVLLEANIVYNDIANIAVINATEIARKKKMTVMEDDDNSVIEEAAITVNEINADQIPEDKDFEAYEEQLRNKNAVREQNNVQVDAENADFKEDEKQTLNSQSVDTASQNLQNNDAVSQNAQEKPDSENINGENINGENINGENNEVGDSAAKSDNNAVAEQQNVQSTENNQDTENNQNIENNRVEKTTALNAGGEAVITVKAEELVNSETVKNETLQAKPEEKQELKEVKTEEKPKVKTYVRRTKRLPMFMMRPTPQTPEGFIAENFRLFVKRALLIKMQNEQTGTYPPPSYVLVNMPQKYAFVIDEINKETDNGLDFVFFNPEKENNLHLTNNLELYGALFIANYNKSHNF